MVTTEFHHNNTINTNPKDAILPVLCIEQLKQQFNSSIYSGLPTPWMQYFLYSVFIIRAYLHHGCNTSCTLYSLFGPTYAMYAILPVALDENCPAFIINIATIVHYRPGCIEYRKVVSTARWWQIVTSSSILWQCSDVIGGHLQKITGIQMAIVITRTILKLNS